MRFFQIVLTAALFVLPASSLLSANDALTPASLDRPIHEATGALVKLLGKNGKFLYLFNLKNPGKPSNEYNLIRHAGAIHALAMVQERFPAAEVKSAIVRAGHYLAKTGLRRVHVGKKDMLAIFTDPELMHVNKGETEPFAELGGSGLGLVALLEARKQDPGALTLADARKIGRFLLFMQTSNGDFYTQYSPQKGRMDQFVSLFYPGEAILALIRLYQADPNRAWLDGAARGLRFLGKSRVENPGAEIPLDNWALVATAEILKSRARLEATDIDLFTRHAKAIVRVDLLDQITKPARPEETNFVGGFNPEGLTTKTATRLEGMLSILPLLQTADPAAVPDVQRSVRAGISFLLLAQIHDGPYRGAIPGTAPLEGGAIVDERSTEIRIDYIQHALSAILLYRDQMR